VRVADVAERAGTGAPSVLYYFASKAELLKEALTTAEERFYAALWRELWGRALSHPDLAATRAELDVRWRRAIAEVVRYGQERGEFGPADPDEVAVLLAALLDGLAVQIALSVPSDCPQGSEVHLSVRPEKIWLDELEEGMVALDGTVVERVYVGTTTQVIVELGPGMRVTALEQNVARARSDDRWQIGDRVRLGWHREHARVLR
jgi:hypothetical protein